MTKVYQTRCDRCGILDTTLNEHVARLAKRDHFLRGEKLKADIGHQVRIVVVSQRQITQKETVLPMTPEKAWKAEYMAAIMTQ